MIVKAAGVLQRTAKTLDPFIWAKRVDDGFLNELVSSLL